MIEYARLTWPEVDALDRNLPLYLPLGPADCPEDGVVLPSVPYGFPGSGLEVPGWRAYVDNLIDGLRADGFRNVHVLSAPSEVEVEPEPVLLIPVGHTEQHGYHLSMAVDTVLIDAVAEGVVRRMPGQAARLPVMPYGVSTHRPCFRGTFNAGGRAFEDFYLQVLEELYRRGVRRFYLLSGHGGNCSFMVTVVKYFGERHPDAFCATSFLYLSGPSGVEALERHRTSPRGGMGHGGELETSLMLHLAPEQVFMDRVVDELDFVSTESYFMEWIEGGALVANPSWYDDTVSGAYGAGSHATAEKGRLWLEAAVEEKAGHVLEIAEQHRRRLERQREGFGRWSFSDDRSGPKK